MILSVLEHLSKRAFAAGGSNYCGFVSPFGVPVFAFLFTLQFSVERVTLLSSIGYLAFNCPDVNLFLWFPFTLPSSASETERISGFIWDVLRSISRNFILLWIETFSVYKTNPTLLLSFTGTDWITIYPANYTFTINTLSTWPANDFDYKTVGVYVQCPWRQKLTWEGWFWGFAGWCLLFAGFFTGPVVSFNDYENFCLNRRAILKQKSENHVKIVTLLTTQIWTRLKWREEREGLHFTFKCHPPFALLGLIL